VSNTQIAIDILLALGTLTTVISAVAVPTRKDLYDRLHYLAPLSTVAAGCFTLAVLLDKHLSPPGIKALVIFVVLAVTNSVLAHATARAARVRQFGRWMADVSEIRGNFDSSTAGLNSRPLVDSSDE